MKKILSIFMLLVAFTTGAWAAEGDEIYVNDFSTKDQTDFASWIGTGKVPSGYSNTIIGRNGAFSIATGALVNTAPNGKSKNNVYNADFGTFKDAITEATKTTNYVLSFDITLAITNHIACQSIFEISGEDKKTIICLYANHTRANSSSGATTYGYIVGGNNAFATKDATISSKTNTEGTIGDGTQHVIAGPINGMTGSKTYHVVLDAQTNGMASLTIKEGETTIVDGESISISSENGMKYIYLTNYNSWETPSSQITIDNFSIVEGAASTSTTANYTVKYVAEVSDVETEIKPSVIRTGLVNNSISLLDEDKVTVWYNNAKYIYSSDDSNTKTIEEDNSTVVNVSFIEAPLYTYSVIDNLGNILASGSAYEGTDIDFYVPYYVFTEGKFYKSPSLSSGSLSYGKGTISNISSNTEVSVSYTEEENSNVVFFSEAENLEGVTPYEDNYTNIRMSNGKAGYFSSQVAFVTLPVGVYTITTSTRAGTTTFYAGEVGEGVQVAQVTSSGSVVTTTSDEFTLPGVSDIYASVGGTSAYFDYIIIRKTGDIPASISATIPSSEIGTIASAYALDCSKLPNGVKAYKVSMVSANAATLEEVTTAVAPGTGLILRGTAGTYDIPVVAEGTDISGTNELKAAVTATDIEANTAYILQGGQFHLVNAASTVPAGKAYLPAADVNGAKTISLSFGEITGVSEVAAEAKAVADGKFIKNGQLVIEKNGKVFNANGAQVK